MPIVAQPIYQNQGNIGKIGCAAYLGEEFNESTTIILRITCLYEIRMLQGLKWYIALLSYVKFNLFAFII